jgi:hypothetical protein
VARNEAAVTSRQTRRNALGFVQALPISGSDCMAAAVAPSVQSAGAARLALLLGAGGALALGARRRRSQPSNP